MCDALDAGDLEKFMEIVGNFFSGIPYENAGEITEGYLLGRKDSGKEERAEALLGEAEKQARKKGYAERYRNESEEVRLVAVVFDEGTRKMMRWKEVK